MSNALKTILSNQQVVPYKQKAVAILEEKGLPSKRDEVWRNSVPLSFDNLLQAASKKYYESIKPTLLSNLNTIKIIFIDGYYAPNLSDKLPDNMKFISLAEALENNDPILERFDNIGAPYQQGYKALNSVMCKDGAILSIEKNVEIKTPIHFIFKNISPDTTAYGRILLNIGQGANASFIVENDTASGQFENHVIECFVEENANVKFLKTNSSLTHSHNLHSFSAQLLANSTLNLAYYNLSNRFSRHETNIYLNGKGSEVKVGGAIYLKDNAKKDHTACVIHNSPYCNSSQNFQSLCDDQSYSVVQSKTIVAKDAQKTNAEQNLRSYLLTDNSQSFAKPELEIYADDVKCAHGSTIGRLDAMALYYMRSRGIPLSQARVLLTRSYMAEALEIIDLPDVTDILLEHFSRNMVAN